MLYFPFSTSSFIGKKNAAEADMAIVRMIVLVPEEIPEKIEALLAIKLKAKLMPISPIMILFLRAGGKIIAKNIPYRATLNALTTLIGRMLPAIIPAAVPNAQAGDATTIAP